MKVILKKSPNPLKKFRATFENGKHVDFGARGYSDYTIHKDPERMRRYMIRHQKRENWGSSGVHTPGFWSRWLLWSKPSMQEAKKGMSKKFNLAFIV